MLVGGAGSDRSEQAWRQTYRALLHGPARQRCAHDNIEWFPNEIQDLANVFVNMQTKRHSADYDPEAAFLKPEVIQDIDETENVILQFPQASRKDRRAFAIYLLFKIRN